MIVGDFIHKHVPKDLETLFREEMRKWEGSFVNDMFYELDILHWWLAYAREE